jgi:hypothetical protein
MRSASDERQLLLAIQAIKLDPILSCRRAAKIYNVSRATLSQRLQGRQSRRDSMPNSRKLNDLEEATIVRYILELDSQGFPPRLSHVEDMANRLRYQRDASPVGKNWTTNFIKRQPELQTRFTRKYDYQRALCEDPSLIRGWFTLVQNTIAKYGINAADIFNFDETGFMMGVISSTMVVTRADRRGKPKMNQPGNREWVTVIQGVNSTGWAIPPFLVVAGQNHLANWYQDREIPKDWVITLSSNGWTTNEIGLEWIKHFDKHTRLRTVGRYRLLIVDGHESHHSADFELYCKENNIITLCMPAHSSHLLQPLDVGCFSPLKRVYSCQIEDLIRAHVSHITKADFFPAFKTAFCATFTERNIKAGFRGAGLTPFDPNTVISKLDVKLHTPTPPGSSSGSPPPWESKTPQNLAEATSQTEFIKNRIANHQNSSPTSIYTGIDQIAKGAQQVMHQLALLKGENASLRKANEALSKRRRAKKTQIRKGGSLSFQDGQDIIDQRDATQQMEREIRENGGRRKRVETRERRCGRCGNTGHNARTCQEVVDTSSEEDSD